MGLLLLADSRLPAGGHGHSGGIEALVDRGLLRSTDDLHAVLPARVRTTAAVPAGAAAAACALATPPSRRQESHHQDTRRPDGGFPDTGQGWRRWDAAGSVRMAPAAALRDASRAQGAALLRTAGAAWPSPALDALRALRRPHHALVLGAAAAAAGATPAQAAALAVHHLIGGACTAAVRLLGLDPLAVGALAARAGRQAEPVAAGAADAALAAVAADDPALLPTDGNPLADVLAELHHRSEATLFAS
ncbi:urease accessory protein UreF [Pseudonocardia humida]|nr:urease accessory UreF family protein [Pseudonocardia humida]